MVKRMVYVAALFAISIALINPGQAAASYCGPAPCAPNVAMKAPMPMGPMPGMAVPGPVMGPAPISCMPNCPPPCPPPACGPSIGSGFNPLSAIFSVIAFPFKLIGGAFNKSDCMPMCPPPACMPMMPACGPQPIQKCKPPKKAAYMPGPMGY